MALAIEPPVIGRAPFVPSSAVEKFGNGDGKCVRQRPR
jgi:hypothetical protein